jgi:hypothetical protein
MKEQGPGKNPNQEPKNHRIEDDRPTDDGTVLLPETLKEKLPTLYSQENEEDPTVICKFFDPVGSWTWYAAEGSPVDEDGYYDTDKPKVDFLFFGLVVGNERELGYFSLKELETAKQGLKGMKALPIERDVYFTPRKLSEVKKKHDIS